MEVNIKLVTNAEDTGWWDGYIPKQLQITHI